MNVFLQFLLDNWQIVVASLLIPIVKVAIDSFNEVEVEKLLKTNTSKLATSSAKILMLSILGTFIFYGISHIVLENTAFKERLLTSFLASFIFILILFGSLSVLLYFFRIKFDFTITLNDGIYSIIRRSNSNTVLLASNNKFRFLEWSEIKKETIEIKAIIYKYEKLDNHLLKNQLPYLILTGIVSIIIAITNPSQINLDLILMFRFIGMLITYIVIALLFIAQSNNKIKNKVSVSHTK